MISMKLSPCLGPGGNEYLQIRLIEYLSRQRKKWKLFGTKQCFVYEEIMKRKLDFVFIEIDKNRSKKDYSRYLSKDDLLITTNGNFFECILMFSKSEGHIMLWDLFHPWFNGFIYGKKTIPIKPFVKHQEIKILSLLNSSNALFFIDVMGKSIVEKRLNLAISDQQYLPIPITIPDKVNLAPVGDLLNITYIGRCVTWKVKPVIKILSDILYYNLSDKVVLNIVTDNVSNFRTYILEKFDIEKFKIIFHESLSENDVNQLFKYTNLNIGMGTAALDGAKNGIPTIVIDASYDEFPDDYRYRWIFETKDLILGKMIEKEQNKFDGDMTFEEVLKILSIGYNELAQKCYDYVRLNYDIDLAVNKIERYSENASLSVSSFSALLIIRYYKLLRILNIRY